MKNPNLKKLSKEIEVDTSWWDEVEIFPIPYNQYDLQVEEKWIQMVQEYPEFFQR